jgi:hypothetical protein
MIQTHIRNLLFKIFKYNKETVSAFSKDLVLLPLTGFYFNDGKSLKELQKEWFDHVKLYKEPVIIIDNQTEKKKSKAKVSNQENEKKETNAVQISLF